MIERIVERSVAWAIAHAKLVILLCLALTVAAGLYAARNLTMDTDTARMISPDLPWKQEMAKINAAFPQNVGLLVAMVDGRTPDAAEDAAATLFAKMKERTDLFETVRRADGGPFYDRYGLMLLDTKDLDRIARSVIRAQPFIASLAADPSLRGLFNVLSLAMEGVARKATDFASLERPLAAISGAMSAALTGNETPLSWRSLMIDRPVDPRELRKLILAQPKRDFRALQPGAKATAAVRQMVSDLSLTPDRGVTVRLTGQVPLNDEEFGTVAEGMSLALFLSIALVLTCLFAALRSIKLIVACFVTLIMGLILTFGFAALAVGSLNLVSIAFAVMFIGLSIDFGIQFGVRYGQERFIADDGTALPRTGRFMARPLTLAAIAIAAGFLSFTPTDYKGVSELGLIAGAGMAITLVLNLSLLPALLKVFPPASQPIDMGFAWARPIDDFLLRRRWPVLAAWVLVGLVGVIAAMNLRFDFNPLHLKDPKAESVSSILDLMKDPLRTPYTIEILTPDIAAAQALADKIGQLPEVNMVLTANSFVPKDQEAKLAIIQDLNDLMGLSLDPIDVAAPPTPDQVRASLRRCAAMLREAVPSSDVAQQLARLLDQAADSDDAFLKRLDHVLLSSLMPRLDALKAALTAKPVTVDTLPPEIRNDWIAADGRARVLVIPAGDSNNNAVLERFITAVRTVAPQASGAAVQIYEAGRAVSHAFEIATLFAMASMAVLLGVILRRAVDVVMVLVPLAAAALATAIICWLIGLQLNFANIIALPLLLGIGVAFNIYFVVNWRNGISGPLQTSTARGVLFSGLTTGSSFASLAVSGHLGTASMGIVLLTGMAMTLVSIFTLMPALLGPVPKDAGPQVT
ncbi:MMPL family transporter [Dongia deserti]|uniref:MMPL family transporter n=1 Tax=Dongia deserti TaxID=2268030 RepID=UPI000E647578|nr:MMPL family transporter [Dongia deserti]